MPGTLAQTDEITVRGEDVYERQIRAIVEVPENVGKLISIDVVSGDYEVGDDFLETGRRLMERRPSATLYGKRVGYDAVYSLGGALTRTAR